MRPAGIYESYMYDLMTYILRPTDFGGHEASVYFGHISSSIII